MPPSPSQLATAFPQLEILELIGTGGMGAVYKARQPHLDRLVALKILPPELGQDPAFEERFSREARALAQLSHPNIVAVYDFGQTDGLYYFIMEYVDGTNVRELIRHGRLKPEEALAIVPQICEALQFAHDEGIVHRDIKPENILIDKNGRVKIADFGLAKIVRPSPQPLSQGESGAEGGVRGFTLTATGQVMGTPHYMAPEQMKGSHAVDHRADIYSLGVMFYEMLTGELPIGKFEPPSKKVQIDVRLDEVVLRALENEPDRRYQKASEVKTDVEAISSGPQPAAVPPKTSPPVSPTEREIIESARQQVLAPAIGLMVAGCIGPCLVLVLGVVGIVHTSFSLNTVFWWPGWLGILFWESLLGLFILIGARKMRHLESYGFAMVSAILAVLPILGPHYIVSLPMGMWALIVLTRPEVKAAFARSRGATAVQTDVESTGAGVKTVAWVGLGLAIGGLVLPVLLAFIGSLVTDKDVTALCLVLYGVLEFAALCCGIIARRVPAGKTALAISGVAIVIGGFLVLFFMPGITEWTLFLVSAW